MFPDTHEFLVFTYNVGNGRADPARLAKILVDQKPDIVGLQELSHSQAETLTQLISSEYPYRSVFPDGFAGKAILSRFPISKTSQVHLGPERPDLLVSLTIDGFQLSVISAHPPPPRFQKTKFGFEPGTLEQIRSLASLTIENQPAILLGDFNFVSRQDEHQIIKSAGLRDAFLESGRGAGYTLPRRIGPWRRMRWLNSLLSWIPLIPVVRVDYIWYTEQLSCTSCWVGDDAGSDHMPVFARLKIGVM